MVIISNKVSHQQKSTKCRGIKYTNWHYFFLTKLENPITWCCILLLQWSTEYFVYLFRGTQAFIMITRVGDIISNLHKKLIILQLNCYFLFSTQETEPPEPFTGDMSATWRSNCSAAAAGSRRKTWTEDERRGLWTFVGKVETKDIIGILPPE